MANDTTDNDFQNQVLDASKPVLVDFWAEWCGPCKQLAPIVDEIAGDNSEKIDVFKLNIDQNPETPTKYGVRGIPTLVIFKDGEPAATKVGSMPKGALQEWIDSVVA